MLFRRKNRGPMISSSCDYPALRLLLLMGIFTMTASAYWWHFDRRMTELAPPDGSYSVSDKDKILSKAEEKRVYEWREAFKETWGIDVFVMVSAGPLNLPDFPSSTLFVGAGIAHHDALIVLPPLAKKALGEDTRIITEETLALCIKQNALATNTNTTPDNADNTETTVSGTITTTPIANTKLIDCLDTALQSLWDNF